MRGETYKPFVPEDVRDLAVVARGLASRLIGEGLAWVVR